MHRLSRLYALASWRRLVGFRGQILVSGLAFLAAIAMILIVFFYYSWPRERSVFVVAHTQTATIQFSKSRVWRLGGVDICVPKQEPRSRRADDKVERPLVGQCQADEESYNGSLNVRWRPNASIRLHRTTRDALTITVQQPDAETQKIISIGSIDGSEILLPAKTRIVVPAAGVDRLGAKIFQGRIELGQPITEGTSGVLLQGTYEIREFLPFRYTPTVVKTGTLVSGDTVKFLNDNDLAEGNEGFVSAPPVNKRGFYLTTTATSNNNVTLRLIRNGFQPTSVIPEWTDRALADPWAIALTVVLGVLVAFITLIVELSRLWRKDQ